MDWPWHMVHVHCQFRLRKKRWTGIDRNSTWPTDYRRPNALPAETLLKYLPRANKDKDDEDEVDGKGRFKHYLYTKECYLWGSDDFSQLYHSSVPFEKVPMEMVELDRTLKGKSISMLGIGKGHYACTCMHSPYSRFFVF
jgi:hypothetical protein